MMQTIPVWLQRAFADWMTRCIYRDRAGNYRGRRSGKRIVPYNAVLKRLYPDNRDFHRAAEAWLMLWETVPTARLTLGRIGTTHAGVQS